MLAVHGLWSPGRGVVLWAEDGERPVRSPSQALRRARRHPFAVAAQALTEIHPGKPTMVTMLLPSLASAPLDSAELVRASPRPAPRRAPVLTPWVVPALVVDPSELDDPAAHVRYGASVAHLRELVGLAADLVARGRVLPTLVWESGAPAARWRPVVTGPDAVALGAVVATMPPVARAEQGARGGTVGQEPQELVADALAALVDGGVRTALARAPRPVELLAPRRGRRPRRTPAVEAWLTALTGADGRLPPECDEDDVAGLTRALGGWDEVGTAPAGPARAVFRLAEAAPLDDPADPDLTLPDTVWRVELWLRSAADPSLQVPAEHVWNAPEGLQRWIARPQEVLLAELGRASVVFGELAETLRQARPSVCELDVEGAHRFLSHTAGLLDAAGFGVELPSWWDGRRRVGLVASARTPAEAAVTAGGLSREMLADFRWSLAVGGETLTEAEIADLVAAKAPLVRLRGQWVALDPERLRRGLDFLRRAPTPRTAAEVLALAATHPDDAGLPLPLEAVHAEGWLADLLAGSAERTLRPVDPPPGFGATLRPYQQRGLSWLAFLSGLGLGACLADDMGLGKTVQVLALEATERAGERATERAGDGDAGPRPPTLLLCPMSLVGNWQREAGRFAPGLRVYAHHGPGRRHGDELAALLDASDLVVTTYTTATRDVDELAGRTWHRLVLDEAQAVKNSRSSAAKAVRRLPADHRVALTGTPVENRLAELWSVMDVLNPGLLGTAETFRARFAVPVERHGDADAAALLRRVTRPYLLRRVKTDPTVIDDLPEKIEIRQDYRLTPEQASLYRTVVDDMMERIEGSDGIARRGNVLAAMAKLKQVCNHPAQLLHDRSPIGRRSGKVVRLEEILGEICARDEDERDKVLCFTQFTEFGEMLVPHLSALLGAEVLYLHGGTPRRRRDEMVARFQDPDGPAVFVLSLKAGGTGLNLTAANHVVHLDRWWNPAVEDQATDRAFRIGQRRTVQVHKFCAAGTLEERIDAMIERKRALAEMVVGDGEGWLTELSSAELRALFALGAEALDES